MTPLEKRRFLRELATKMGYAVHTRSSHGPSKAFDWGPKHPSAASHFATSEAAWMDLEEVISVKLAEANRLIEHAALLIKGMPPWPPT